MDARALPLAPSRSRPPARALPLAPSRSRPPAARNHSPLIFRRSTTPTGLLHDSPVMQTSQTAVVGSEHQAALISGGSLATQHLKEDGTPTGLASKAQPSPG